MWNQRNTVVVTYWGHSFSKQWFKRDFKSDVFRSPTRFVENATLFTLWDWILPGWSKHGPPTPGSYESNRRGFLWILTEGVFRSFGRERQQSSLIKSLSTCHLASWVVRFSRSDEPRLLHPRHCPWAPRCSSIKIQSPVVSPLWVKIRFPTDSDSLLTTIQPIWPICQ